MGTEVNNMDEHEEAERNLERIARRNAGLKGVRE
jgi:hypothetical protein